LYTRSKTKRPALPQAAILLCIETLFPRVLPPRRSGSYSNGLIRPDYHDDRNRPKKWALCAKVFSPKMKSYSMKYTKFLPICILLIVSACAAQSVNSPVSSSPTLSIVHLNDTYRVGDVEEGRRGGYGRVATLVRRLQAQGNIVHITHGGDFIYPSLESQLWNGEQMIEALNFLNTLAPVYLVPVNHELFANLNSSGWETI
jgi:hypothetical protein